jgi:hypothetical protein
MTVELPTSALISWIAEKVGRRAVGATLQLRVKPLFEDVCLSLSLHVASQNPSV